MNEYTARNTFDYFIHKDLRQFLRRELDFYIKNEVMHLDDIENETVSKVEQYLGMIRVIRKIAHKIIDFLAQLENFQKKLWEKKKFVIETFYIITVGNIPDIFYPEIALCDRQWEEWENLLALSSIPQNMFSEDIKKKEGRIAFLKNHSTLSIDTRYFSFDFTNRLLGTLTNLDDKTDGLLVHSENWQALNLLQERYREKVDCVYIDPPYNTQTSEIPFKNCYKHSSWLCLVENRLSVTLSLLSANCVYVIAIDEVEQEKLGMLLTNVFLDRNKSCVTIVHNATGQQGSNFSYTHEYTYFLYPHRGSFIGLKNREDNPDVRPLRDVSKGAHLRTDAANCFYPIFIKNGKIIGFGDVCDDNYHPAGPNVQHDNGVIAVYPIDIHGVERKWVFARQTVDSILDELEARKDEKTGMWDIIRTKKRFNYKTVWTDSKYSANSYGSRILNELLPGNPFAFPKSVYTVRDCVDAALNNKSYGLIMDYFAGSGTTGHAVINLNREDNGNRKFILVEMAHYFDTVLLPRIKKVIFTPVWKDGKPKRMATPEEGQRSPRIIKVIRLESYEDTLNNLSFKRTDIQQKLLDENQNFHEDYMLSYMLDVETRDSLLNLTVFEDPFNYKLNISTGTVGETKPTIVDLVETFNYLLGLSVHQIKSIQGFKTVYGTSPKNEKVLVIWRSLKEKSNEDLENFFLEQGFQDKEFDLIYVNGDNNLENLRNENNLWKVKLIEEDFKRLMFNMEDP